MHPHATSGDPTVYAFFLVIFFVIGLGVLVYGLREWRRSRATLRWAQVNGRIESFEVVSQQLPGRYGMRTVFRPRLTYRYTADGLPYRGHLLNFDDESYQLEASVRERCDPEIIGHDVTVHYNPANPYQAVLIAGASKSVYGMLTFGAITVATTALLGIARWL